MANFKVKKLHSFFVMNIADYKLSSGIFYVKQQVFREELNLLNRLKVVKLTQKLG